VIGSCFSYAIGARPDPILRLNVRKDRGTLAIRASADQVVKYLDVLVGGNSKNPIITSMAGD
jgi:hypothetical protein